MHSEVFLMFVFFLGLQVGCTVADVQQDDDIFIMKLRMNNATSNWHDSHICSAIKLDSPDAYIVKFEPVATSEVAHHMVLAGCAEPRSTEPYWECENHSYCKEKDTKSFIYIWALNGTSRTLPEGVGFHIGGRSKINYLIIGMHYKNKFEEEQVDSSGFDLHVTHKRQPYQMGYYLLGTNGFIPPMTEEYLGDTGCKYEDEDPIYPFAYRTHSHNLGVVTSGYLIRNGVWTEIGRMSPQLPQTFYNITTPGMVIQRGDYMVARCTMQSNRTYVTYMGETNKDEMCNFFIMFYKKTEDHFRKMTMCFLNPKYFKLDQQFTNVPENISRVDDLPPFEMNDPYEFDTE